MVARLVMRLSLASVSAITLMLSILGLFAPPASLSAVDSAATSCETLDQYQLVENYGFWFEDDVLRWQEFIPTLSYVTSVEVLIAKQGEPGGVIIEIRTQDEVVMARQMIPEADVPRWDWTRAEFAVPVRVSPGSTYRIYVYSDTDSTSPENRYFWRGDQYSTYPGRCDANEVPLWPDYDYAFKSYGADLKLIYLPMLASD